MARQRPRPQTTNPFFRTIALGCAAALTLAACGSEGTGDSAQGSAEDLHSAAKVTLTASASPAAASANQQVDVSLTVTSSTLVSGDVSLRVLAPDGSTAYTASWPARYLVAKTPMVLDESIFIDTTDPAGTYTIGASVTRSGSTSALFDANGLASFTVTGAAQASTITMGESNVLSGNDSGNADLLIAQQATLSESATLESLSFYVDTAAGDLRLGVYDATGAGGNPGALQAATASFTPIAGWNTQSVTTPVLLQAGTYWLAYLPSSSSLAFRDSYGSGTYRTANFTFGPMRATFPSAVTSGTDHWSFYATLNAGPCTPSCTGKACGADGCGGSCGTCSSGTCDATGQCVAAPPAPPPAGVTFAPIDGGPTYYASNGFTAAAAAGWDSPSFFPIGLWLSGIITQDDAARWLDLGLNVAIPPDGASDSNLLRANGIWAIMDGSAGTSSFLAGWGSESVGILSQDEPPDTTSELAAITTVPDSVQTGRFWYANFAHDEVSPPGGDAMDTAAQTGATDPSGVHRRIDALSYDLYYFSGAATGSFLHEAGRVVNNGVDLTIDQMAHSQWYGQGLDQLRQYAGQGKIPLFGFVENGGAYASGSQLGAPTPDQMNAAIWNCIIHGARGIIYFGQSFGASPTNDVFANADINPAYQANYNQAKATNALIKQLAPVINSPTALNYVTVTPAQGMYAGLDVLAKYDGKNFYLFTSNRSASATNATFTVNGTPTMATAINENRTIPITNGVFTDTFADRNTVHIYQL
jgi:hypothetical protein